VKLWVEPRIQHGDRQQWIRPNADVTQLTQQVEVPVEKYPALGCEVALSPDDYLLVGWDSDRPDSLGSVMFGATAQGGARQRLLVVRARYAGPVTPADLPPITGPIQRPAVARQAAMPKVTPPGASATGPR
jgi:hypothetical protein